MGKLRIIYSSILLCIWLYVNLTLIRIFGISDRFSKQQKCRIITFSFSFFYRNWICVRFAVTRDHSMVIYEEGVLKFYLL